MTSLAELADTFRTIADETGQNIVKGSPAAAFQMGRYTMAREAMRYVEQAMRERCVIPPPQLRLVDSIQPHQTCHMDPGECECNCETCLVARGG